MLRITLWIGGGLLGLLLLALLAGALFVNFAPAFGDQPSGESLARIQASPNFDGEKFVNLLPTRVDTRDPAHSASMFEQLLRFFSPAEDKNPRVPLPAARFEASDLPDDAFVWLGHSTILMKTGGLFILTDPVFHEASPLPGTVEPFALTEPYGLDNLPARLDVVLISHDHYDHLDYQAIQELEARTERFFVPLGIKAHLLHWGVPEAKIAEHDWYDSLSVGAVQFIMTPARHFSGRGLTNRFSTLWCSWVIHSPSLRIFFNGDSGYFPGYKEIGQQYGPFDIAFIENGAYDRDWSEIHLMPEEGVQANLDLRSAVMFPIHWGKYDLANHSWDDPIIRADRETTRRGVRIATPVIGEVFTLDAVPHSKWWEAVRGER